MHRELYSILVTDKPDAPPLVPQSHASMEKFAGYKHTKAKLGLRRVRQWRRVPFTNPARTVSKVFKFWEKKDGISKLH